MSEDNKVIYSIGIILRINANQLEQVLNFFNNTMKIEPFYIKKSLGKLKISEEGIKEQ